MSWSEIPNWGLLLWAAIILGGLVYCLLRFNETFKEVMLLKTGEKTAILVGCMQWLLILFAIVCLGTYFWRML